MGTYMSTEGRERLHSTFSDPGIVNAPGSSDFGYEEFGGKDGKTCPTCQGTGRVLKHQEDELVALIPYSDKRLKPRRTTTYVVIAISVCLIVCGLILFFILPRSVKIQEGMILNHTVKIEKNLSSTEITVNNQFNITNTNFFHIKVTKVTVEAFFDRTQVGQGHLKDVPVNVPPRMENYKANVTIKMQFNTSNQLEFMCELCTNKAIPAHDIVIKFQATLTSEYLSHSEQDTITTYKYIDCSPQKSFWHNPGLSSL